jgi:16S rRNA C967 or C1407 C5-methylase (RsmB/RsmF family)
VSFANLPGNSSISQRILSQTLILKSFYHWLGIFGLMSGKEFFTSRYERLGWKYQEVTLKQAIRINITNSKGKKLLPRLEGLGVHLQKIPFLDSGYWVVDSKVSAGATAEYLLGLYSIQEAAAQIPVSLFTHLKGRKVLDAAAAPGGKTVHLADLMDNDG